ncbi:MAG: hypothetical protein HW401_387 [Parcubacteria group bacterium]|nr:hypothetical protein [Parcubacteria group bacterium]
MSSFNGKKAEVIFSITSAFRVNFLSFFCIRNWDLIRH